ncbi:conserved hypothetical protein [Roseibium sp. TrichSKD4]|nr:conserved hypothetical protein [Roseibium sp. TrichSKD4]
MKVKPKRMAPFPLRLTLGERKELERRAGEMALGAYIKAVLFADGVKHRRRGARAPVKDHVILAKVLACLGSSGLVESLERLSKAAESGVIQWDADAPAAVRKACEDIVLMRLLLMRALGFQVDEDALSSSLRQSFNQAACDPDRGLEE